MPHDPLASPVDRGSGLSRRGFLAGGGALAAVVLLGPRLAKGPAAPGRVLAASGASALLPVAYLSGSEQAPAAGLDDLSARPWRAVPAHSLATGDRALSKARVRILGLWPKDGASRPAVDLDVLVAQANGPPVPFFAWTVRPAGTSSPVGFNVAGADEDSLTIVRHILATGTSGPKSSGATLTTGSWAGVAKMRPGTYLVSLSDQAWPASGVPVSASPTSIVLVVGPAAQ